MDSVVGKAWTKEDLKQLKEALLVITEEEGASYALELLKHGNERTPMTREQFDTLYKEIIAHAG